MKQLKLLIPFLVGLYICIAAIGAYKNYMALVAIGSYFLGITVIKIKF